MRESTSYRSGKGSEGNVLASASADKTVKIWDIATETAKSTLNHHKDKVQACEWNPSEASVLLTGSYDKTAQVVDVRTPDGASLKWTVSADVESAIWHTSEPTQFLVSNEDGMVMCFDTRMGSIQISWNQVRFRYAYSGL